MKRSIEADSPLYGDFQLVSQKLRQRIVALRYERGLTQEDMQLHGMSLRQYQRIESGETENITLVNLYRIALVLGVSLPELLSFD